MEHSIKTPASKNLVQAIPIQQIDLNQLPPLNSPAMATGQIIQNHNLMALLPEHARHMAPYVTGAAANQSNHIELRPDQVPKGYL